MLSKYIESTKRRCFFGKKLTVCSGPTSSITKWVTWSGSSESSSIMACFVCWFHNK